MDRVASVNARIGWKALTADEYQPEGYAFLSTPNIKDEQIDFDNVNYISKYRYDESPELKLSVGDVLLAKDGNTLGITNLVRELPWPASVNGSIAVIRPYRVAPAFLRYVLASDFSQGRIAAFKGGMGVPHLFQWDIKRLPVPMPPSDDQQRIVNFLDTESARIDTLVAKKDRMAELLTARLEALMERSTVTEATGRPVRLKHVTSIERGRFNHRPRNEPALYGEEFPFVQTGDISRRRALRHDCDAVPQRRREENQ